jgi:hypothetical protein
MSDPNRQEPRSTLRKLALVPVVLLAGVVVYPLVLELLPMGSGSVKYSRLWRGRFVDLSAVQAARSAFPQVRAREFENGEWILLVSDNSHGDPWGGTVVTKDSKGEVKTFYGHVCGRADTGSESKSLSDVYRVLSKRYGTTPDEGERKAARGAD